MQVYYTGVGSRQTPQEVLLAFESIAKYLASIGWVLRSGAADGADRAFEKGCDAEDGKKEIYLPWKNFNNSLSDLIVKDQKAFEIAKEHHPGWDNLKFGAQKLHARNVHQVLGKQLDNPSSLLICWTPNGSGKGGTGQAIRLANSYKVPVIDAGAYPSVKEFKQAVWSAIKTIKEKDYDEKGN